MATPAGTTCSTPSVRKYLSEKWMKIRWCGTCGVMGSCGVVGIACGYGKNLMLAAFKVAHMSCTQRQRSGGAQRDEAHVGG